jgi:hypothetical protein
VTNQILDAATSGDDAVNEWMRLSRWPSTTKRGLSPNVERASIRVP